MTIAGLHINAIVAYDDERAIGKNGALPWHIPEDLKHFSNLTRGHAVVMGRTTWESLPEKYRPLPGRINIVLSKTRSDFGPGVYSYKDLDALGEALLSESLTIGSNVLWVIGGAQIYDSTIHLWDELYVTKVKGQHNGDTFFPRYENAFVLLSAEDHDRFSFCRFQRVG